VAVGGIIALIGMLVITLTLGGTALDFWLYLWLIGRDRSRTVRIGSHPRRRVGLTAWGAAHLGLVVFVASR